MCSISEGYNIKAVENYLSSQGIDDNSIDKVKDKAIEVYNYIEPVDELITGLILGKIQSGKTNSFLMTLAVAADNGFNSFIVLTSDDDWLYKQTVARIREAHIGLYVLTKDKFLDDIDIEEIIESYNGIILVCTKNWVQLPRMKDLITSTTIRESSWIMIDDEADQASLDTQKNVKSSARKPSKINAAIAEAFEGINIKAYIQVTATPQALLLQSDGTPFRPDFITIIEPGQDYVGGDELFSSDYSRDKYLRIYTDSDIDLSIPESAEIGFPMPKALKDSLCTFIISATAKFLMKEGTGFSFICNVSLRQDLHEYIKNIIELYLKVISKTLKKFDVTSEEGARLKKTFDDIASTLTGIPTFDTIINTLKFSLAGSNVQVINSSSDQKLPDYSSIYNFIIGGTKLSRGVTIKRLITTYYDRYASTPKMDTVHQHARMYGYRKEDLNVIRVFITNQLANRFDLINQSDNMLRKYIIENAQTTGVTPIFVADSMDPTRRNVIPSDDVIALRSGVEYFPHYPKYKRDDVEKDTIHLDTLLNSFKGVGRDSAKKVSIRLMIEILSHIHSEKVSNDFWEDERIIAILQQLKDAYDNTGYIIVRTDRNIGNNPYRGISAILSPADHSLAINESPSMFIYRLTGDESNGWDGCPFWVPVIKLPNDKNYVFIMNIG